MHLNDLIIIGSEFLTHLASPIFPVCAADAMAQSWVRRIRQIVLMPSAMPINSDIVQSNGGESTALTSFDNFRGLRVNALCQKGWFGIVFLDSMQPASSMKRYASMNQVQMVWHLIQLRCAQPAPDQP